MSELLALLVLVSVAFWVVVAINLVLFHRRAADPPPLDRPVTVLEPLTGVDHGTGADLVTFFVQDHPDLELVFGVAEDDDPAVPLVRRLMEEHPEVPATLAVGAGEGSNPKVAILQRMVEHAEHETLLVVDSDMRVEPGYVRRLCAPLAEEGVGLVTCPYRAVELTTFAAKLEGLYVDTHFTPAAVFAATRLGIPFGLGSGMAMRRTDLDRIGGFAAVAEHLADDHELGARIARLGERVVMVPEVPSTVVGATTFSAQWQREVRWARAARVSRPTLAPGFLVTLATPLALLHAFSSGWDPTGRVLLVAALAVRWAVGWVATTLTSNRELRRWLVLLPLRDCLTALVWVVGLAGRNVSWRGRRYRVRPSGELEHLGRP